MHITIDIHGLPANRENVAEIKPAGTIQKNTCKILISNWLKI